MRFSFVVLDAHDVCAHTFYLQSCAYSFDLLTLWDELEVGEKVRRVGHASRCMVVDANHVGVGVKM